MRRHLYVTALLGLVACLGAPSVARAQQLNVDFFQGPVVNSSRVTGLGGAFVGVAEGADGTLINPSSLAVRYPYTLDDWFDWDFAFSTLSFLGRDGNEIDRSGREGGYDSVLFGEFGLTLKLGRLGFGFHARTQEYEVSFAGEQGADQLYSYEQTVVSIGVAYAFYDGELVVGGAFNGGNSTLEQTVEEGQSGGGAVRHNGGALTLSTLWAPVGKPFRLGATLRGTIEGVIESRNIEEGFVDGQTLGRLRVPDKLLIPWELSLGGSFMTGPRRYNARPTYGAIEGDVERVLARRYLLFSGDLVFTGPAKDAIGTQAFLQGGVQQSGRYLSVSPRFGVESEVWEDTIALRGGTYYEPSRFEGRYGRIHLTGGGDYHFSFGWEWKLSVVLDIADRYSNFGLGLGFWH